MPTLCARIAGADGVGFAQILHKIHSKTEFSRRFGDGKNSILREKNVDKIKDLGLALLI